MPCPCAPEARPAYAPLRYPGSYGAARRGARTTLGAKAGAQSLKPPKP
jgi:hypothetical protein